MKLLSSEPYWPIRSGLPASYPALHENLSCDVAIIGAGVSGALAAWYLSEAGLEVAVLDRRDVAHGSTAGSTGLLQYEIDEPLYKLARRLGPANAVRAYQSCRNAIEGLSGLVRKLRIDCHFEHRASLFLARDRSHVTRLRTEFDARAEAGFEVEWWDRRRLVSSGSLPHPAAILSRAGAQVDTYRLAHGLLAASVRNGVRIHDRTTVTRRRLRARAVELRTDTGFRVTARHLVIATGYETATFPLALRYTALRSTYALISEPVDSLPGWPADRCLLWETGDPYTYVRTTPDNRVIIGGYDEPFSDPAARDRLLGAKTSALQRRLRQLFPALATETAYAWAGTFARTPDGLPLIGCHPGIPRTWFALGYGGNGITYSYIAALLIRDQILGRRNEDGDLLGFARFSALAP